MRPLACWLFATIAAACITIGLAVPPLAAFGVGVLAGMIGLMAGDVWELKGER